MVSTNAAISGPHYLFRQMVFGGVILLAVVSPTIGMPTPENPLAPQSLPGGFEKAGSPIMIPKHDFQFTDHRPGGQQSPFKKEQRSAEARRIEQMLLDINAWEEPEVQKQYRRYRRGLDRNREKARIWLLEYIEDYKALAMRLDDPLMPYARAEQISNHRGIHLLDQAYNQFPMYINPEQDFVLTGMVVGKPGTGKSTAAFNVLRQSNGALLVFDPKGSWRYRARALRAKYIPPDQVVFDFNKPDNSHVTWETWLFALTEGLAQASGLQYGLDPLLQASQMALRQKQDYEEHRSGVPVPLSLKDVAICLPLIESKRGRQLDYLNSAQTAVNLILGPNRMFEARIGLPMEELLHGRYIIDVTSANVWQCRFLGLFVFLYIFYKSFGQPELNRTKHLTVIDDASKFVSKPESLFGGGSSSSAWQHLLKGLRSTGHGWLFVDQTVRSIADDIRQLANFWCVTSDLGDAHNHTEMASAMGLSAEESQIFLRLQDTRECICYCPHYHPRPIHGFIPEIRFESE